MLGCIGGPTPKDIVIALAEAQAVHDAAKAGLHVHAAIKAVPSVLLSPAANESAAASDANSTVKPPAADAEAASETDGIDITSATHDLSAALDRDSILNPSAADADAALEIEGTDNTSTTVAEAALETCSLDATLAAVAEADPSARHAADAAITAQDGPPQQPDSNFPTSAEGAEIDCELQTYPCRAPLEDERLSTEDTAHARVKDAVSSSQGCDPPCAVHGRASVQQPDMQSLGGVQCMQKQQHNAQSETDMADAIGAVDVSLPPTGSMHSRLVQSQFEAKGSLPQEGSVSEAALDKMLELQLRRIQDSAVVLTEPAEVLVTDLFDHRWRCRCAVLCCAVPAVPKVLCVHDA